MTGSPLRTAFSKSSGDLTEDAVEPFLLPRGADPPAASSAPWVPSPSRRVSIGVDQTGDEAYPMLVMKFGGSSLASADHLKRVAAIIRERLDKSPVVVLSAMGKTTNNLLAAAEKALQMDVIDISAIRDMHEKVFKELEIPVPAEVSGMLTDLERLLSGVALLKEVSVQTRDRIVSFGERLSVRTFTSLFNATKDSSEVEAKAFDSWEIGLRTTSGAGSADSCFSQVQVLEESYGKIHESMADLRRKFTYVPIVTGYISQDSKGIITTLGRDGSDYTAGIIGASLKASEVQIWKDVSGIQTIDPRVAPSAKAVRVLTFEEMAELSTFGAKVVHPAAVLPAWIHSVPMSVRNSMEPKDPGTRIVPELSESNVRDGKVAAISSKSNITMIVIKSSRMLGQHGFLAHVFSVFNKFEASVDVIATSEVTVSLTLDQGYKSVDLDSIQKELEKVANVVVKQDMAMLTLITAKEDSVIVMKDSFAAFVETGVFVEMVSHGASNVNVTFVIPGEKLLEASRKLHEVFFER
eukprot:TRINITY_DN109865_c0_g1_i1.p1 TRINITY_DN109865_c0_g1~~TRINITY_DN109865_c0_g1_i1.p1  ORF type:complete len:523 (-),score=116.12 TRINITY_DN109865_c0_g1_i1:101-1669(-)